MYCIVLKMQKIDFFKNKLYLSEIKYMDYKWQKKKLFFLHEMITKKNQNFGPNLSQNKFANSKNIFLKKKIYSKLKKYLLGP